MKLDSINGVLCILISTVKRGFGGISNRVSRKMRIHRATSIAGENSINFEWYIVVVGSNFYAYYSNIKSSTQQSRHSHQVRYIWRCSMTDPHGTGYIQILSGERGPGPLSSDEIWKFN